MPCIWSESLQRTDVAPNSRGVRQSHYPRGRGVPIFAAPRHTPIWHSKPTGRAQGPAPGHGGLPLVPGVSSTLHGFRSSARSWMAESGIPAEVAEACLAHVPRSQVVPACQRSDLLTRCAEVMQAWSSYVTQG